MGSIEIIDFSDNLKVHFRKLNVEWLEKYYRFRIIPKSDFHNERANIKMEMILK
jgi:hypothetical protein